MQNSITVEGGVPLKGSTTVSGGVNSATELIIASLFSNEDIYLENVPRAKKVLDLIAVIQNLGVRCEWVSANRLLLNSSGINSFELDFTLAADHRFMALLSAPLIFRFGKALLPQPAGPINRWVQVWEAFGLEVQAKKKEIYLTTGSLAGTTINFKKSTHIGTEIAVLFSIFAPGKSTIINAAEEPEVDSLTEFCNQMGADINRLETRTIKSEARHLFKGVSFEVSFSRLEAVALATGALLTKGNILLDGVSQANLLSFANVLTKMNCRYEFAKNQLKVWYLGEDIHPTNVTVVPAPGLMADWQPYITLLLTQAAGESLVHDTVFVNGFDYVQDLNRMGARIELFKPSEVGLAAVVSDDSYDFEKLGEPTTVAKVKGSTKIKGTRLDILSPSCAGVLTLAAVAADGKSEITGAENLDFTFEGFLHKLAELGAQIL